MRQIIKVHTREDNYTALINVNNIITVENVNEDGKVYAIIYCMPGNGINVNESSEKIYSLIYADEQNSK